MRKVWSWRQKKRFPGVWIMRFARPPPPPPRLIRFRENDVFWPWDNGIWFRGTQKCCTFIICVEKKLFFLVGIKINCLIPTENFCYRWVVFMQSPETQITMVKWTNTGGQTKRANEWSFVYRPPAWRRWRNVKTTYRSNSLWGFVSAFPKWPWFFVLFWWITSGTVGLVIRDNKKGLTHSVYSFQRFPC